MFAAEARQADAVCRDTAAVSCDASTVKGDSVCVQDIAHGLVGNLASHNVAVLVERLFPCRVTEPPELTVVLLVMPVVDELSVTCSDLLLLFVRVIFCNH